MTKITTNKSVNKMTKQPQKYVIYDTNNANRDPPSSKKRKRGIRFADAPLPLLGSCYVEDQSSTEITE